VKEPANTNFRHYVEQIFDESKMHKPIFGIEQEFTLFSKLNSFTKTPLGWPTGGYPAAEGPYYCSIGSNSCFGRSIMDSHYKACLAAKIPIEGTNGETAPGQWEFQILGEGIEVCDNLWMARYILWRITEDSGVGLSFHPKPIKGWAGSGCHINFSTNMMRAEDGYECIISAIEKLEKKHKEHIELYGEDNNQRLIGKEKTCHIGEFKSGVGDRSVSVRIPNKTFKDGRGYFEDRRPASNMDPYV